MNNARRKELRKVLELINKANELMTEAYDRLDEIKGEEEDSYDNLPECLQDSERGEHMQECIDGMDEILEALECLDIDEIESLIEDM